jgi:FkbH-like protein
MVAIKPSAARKSSTGTLPYTDLIRWQAERLSSENKQKLIDYLQQQLAGEEFKEPRLQLVTGQPRLTTQSSLGSSYSSRIKSKLLGQLKKLARGRGDNVYPVILKAAQKLFMGRVVNPEDPEANINQLGLFTGNPTQVLPLKEDNQATATTAPTAPTSNASVSQDFLKTSVKEFIATQKKDKKGLLYWLPYRPDFREVLKTLKKSQSPAAEKLKVLRDLANHNLDFTETNRLDNRLQKVLWELKETPLGFSRIKLAILSSSTAEHLPPSIRVAALRRGLLAEIYVAPYAQYTQEILNPQSQFYEFAPDAVLLALNYHDVAVNIPLTATAEEVKEQVENTVNSWVSLWERITANLNTMVIQETMVVPPECLFGDYDNLVPASYCNIIAQVNRVLHKQAAVHPNVLLLDVDKLAAYVGKQTWCDDTLWHYAKQDISPVQTPLYGDSMARILAAMRGMSRKCLVLDLDNTLWGGVIGDDGLGGIKLGQGNAEGEAFLAFQAYVKKLKERGIILAVCSKNDEANALEPFEKHPEMILRRDDISIFVANWENKASNIQRIASELNIGLDSLVFFDDNPAERKIVRQFLPMVAVPEVPENSANYVRCLSDAGYFEATSFSKDDGSRTEQYLANAKRKQLQKSAVSVEDFLQSLNMEMTVGEVDEFSLPRTTQLINKTNQFNLTTRRYTEAQVKDISENPENLCLQIRLKDSLGDNGLISVILAKPVMVAGEKILHIDTWLMSCRVLGRQVEREALNVLVDKAKKRGYNCLQGEYFTTAKNGMVKGHYQRLGFDLVSDTYSEDGTLHRVCRLDLTEFVKLDTFIRTVWV